MSNTAAKAPEIIAVVRRKLLDEILPFLAADGVNASTGLHPGTPKQLQALREAAVFLKRDDELEADASLKQLIVYALVEFQGKTLCYKRGKVGQEVRLHAKHSVGVGGHINTNDWESGEPGPEIFAIALERELKEEVGILADKHILHYEFLGFVNEDTTPVGQVHLGLVYRVTLANLEGLAFEEELVDPQWLTSAELQGHADEGLLELWSEIIADGLRAPAPADGLIHIERTVRYDVPAVLWANALPYQQRVIEEKVVLDNNLAKLTEFIDVAPAFDTLGEAKQDHLLRQRRIMGDLSEVLAERIAAFTV